MQNYISIGHTKKLHGIKGGVKLNIKDDYLEDFDKTDVLFLAINGRKIPFFIQKKIHDIPFRVIFEDHNNRELAQALVGKEIFLTDQQVTLKETISHLEYEPYIGYLLKDMEAGKIGVINDILEYPQQEMAIVSYQGRDILIPMNEQLITSINETDRIILVHLPDGLLEL